MRRLVFSGIGLTLFGAITYFNVGSSGGIIALLSPTSASAQSSACAFPTAPAATTEETAWRLFVAANCPGSGTKVVWENWIEQSQLYPASARRRRRLGRPAGKAAPRQPLGESAIGAIARTARISYAVHGLQLR